jgi:hypothetical protein
LLEAEPALKGRLAFSGGEILFRVNDRLLAPNVPEAYDEIEPELRAIAKRLYGDGAVLTRGADTEQLLTLRLTSSGATGGADALLERL